MIRCPVGAIVKHDELKVLAGALDLACQHVEMTINSERRPNRSLHDAEYRSQMSALRESLSLYRSTLKKVDRALKAERRG